MKIFIAISVIIGMFGSKINAQEIKQFLDPQLNLTLSEEKAKFVRTITPLNDTTFQVQIVYKTGETMMTGSFRDKNLIVENGDFVFYYASGGKESQGKYKNGQKVGIWKRWNFDGQEKPDRIYQDENFQETTRITNPARYPGGFGELKKFISVNLKYPEDAKNKNIKGTVYVNFVVDSKGAVTQAVVAEGVYYQLDEEALRLVSNLPDWEPAKRDGKPVSSSFILPVPFGN
jgi:TonB family protein